MQVPIKTFHLYRQYDETGVSGIGVVLEGVIFSNGHCVTSWLSDHPCVSTWDTFDDFVQIHITSHPSNGSQILFSTGETIVY